MRCKIVPNTPLYPLFVHFSSSSFRFSFPVFEVEKEEKTKGKREATSWRKGREVGTKRRDLVKVSSCFRKRKKEKTFFQKKQGLKNEIIENKRICPKEDHRVCAVTNRVYLPISLIAACPAIRKRGKSTYIIIIHDK